MENKTREFFVKHLKETPAIAMEVGSLSEYINAIIAINNIFPKNLFRGQAHKD